MATSMYCLYVGTDRGLNVCMYVCVCVCMHVCMYVHACHGPVMYVCMYVCMYTPVMGTHFSYQLDCESRTVG